MDSKRGRARGLRARWLGVRAGLCAGLVVRYVRMEIGRTLLSPQKEVFPSQSCLRFEFRVNFSKVYEGCVLHSPQSIEKGCRGKH